jgi:hypothetical protein
MNEYGHASLLPVYISRSVCCHRHVTCVNIVPSTSECSGCDTLSISTHRSIIGGSKMFSFTTKSQSDFEKIRDLEGHEHLLADDTHSKSAPQLTVPVARGPSWLTTIVAVICTATLSGLLGILVAHDRGSNADTFCIRRTSQYCKYARTRSKPKSR